jgi:hypothetical protein
LVGGSLVAGKELRLVGVEPRLAGGGLMAGREPTGPRFLYFGVFSSVRRRK